MGKVSKYDKMVLDAIVSGIPLTKEQYKQITHAKKSEADIQKECIDWFKEHHPQLWMEFCTISPTKAREVDGTVVVLF